MRKTPIITAAILSFLFILSIFTSISAQQSNIGWLDADTVKAQKFDTGKMWTFEDAPVDYFDETYGFRPDQKWLDNVRMSSVKFANWCSAGFVSEDGLLMTNHHCVDFILQRIQREGENIPRDGFYAPTLADERRVPNLWVDQLVSIDDVTDEVVQAINKASNDEERLKFKNDKVAELEEKYAEETGLICRITSLYHGGKYSLYSFKRYNDVRAVLYVERIVGLFGGDPDNYTYPRYNADFAFLRVYNEDGQPLKTDNYFKFSLEGPKEGEPLFAVGRPGTTNRLKTIAQLEYLRDETYDDFYFLQAGLVNIFEELMEEYPEKAELYQGAMFGPANMSKRIGGFLTGLRDPYLMARKVDFENNLKTQILSNPTNKEKYGHLWDAIASGREELRKTAGESIALPVDRRSPKYFIIAKNLFDLAKQLQLPEAERAEDYKAEELQNTINNIIPANIDKPVEDKTLALVIDFIWMNLGKEHPIVKKYFNGDDNNKVAQELIAKTRLMDKEYVNELANKGADAILNSNDPFIKYVIETVPIVEKVRNERNEIINTEVVLEDQLGQAIFAVYGTSIPPDATFTLRLSDGLMKGYNYNGTFAPTFTTFYGMYDRYYSHKKTWPWDLPKRWVEYGPEFDLSTMNNFIGTFDSAGGSSGSPIVNKNSEYVGILHDGNMEGLSGNFIYTSEQKRSLGVSSAGIYELIKDLFHADRLAKELAAAKIVD